MITGRYTATYTIKLIKDLPIEVEYDNECGGVIVKVTGHEGLCIAGNSEGEAREVFWEYIYDLVHDLEEAEEKKLSTPIIEQRNFLRQHFKYEREDNVEA